MLLFLKKKGDFNPILMVNEHPPAAWGICTPDHFQDGPVGIAVGGGGGEVVRGQSEKIELSRSGQKK